MRRLPLEWEGHGNLWLATKRESRRHSTITWYLMSLTIFFATIARHRFLRSSSFFFVRFQRRNTLWPSSERWSVNLMGDYLLGNFQFSCQTLSIEHKLWCNARGVSTKCFLYFARPNNRSIDVKHLCVLYSYFRANFGRVAISILRINKQYRFNETHWKQTNSFLLFLNFCFCFVR